MRLFGTNKGKIWRVLSCAISFCLLCSVDNYTNAQIAGLNTLSLLDRGSSARTAGVGFDYLSLYGGDVAIAIDNPSLITADLQTFIYFQF